MRHLQNNKSEVQDAGAYNVLKGEKMGRLITCCNCKKQFFNSDYEEKQVLCIDCRVKKQIFLDEIKEGSENEKFRLF